MLGRCFEYLGLTAPPSRSTGPVTCRRHGLPCRLAARVCERRPFSVYCSRLAMIDLSYAEVEAFLASHDRSCCPQLRIAVLRNVMLETVEPYWQYLAAQIGFSAELQFGNYDNIVQEAVGGAPDLLRRDTDVVMVFSKLETFAPALAYGVAGMSGDQIEEEVARVNDLVSQCVAGIRAQTPAMILWHSFEEATHPALGIFDFQTTQGQLGAVRTLNDHLRCVLAETTNAYLVGMNQCLMRVGSTDFYDWRYWQIGRAPYSRKALCEIAIEDFRFIRSLKGKNKKCLVLDCDNTLWGGIVGEDGIDGIKLSTSYPGVQFFEFQREILNLYNRGIILALCSKNNAEDVWEVFDRHPDMCLRREHIAAAQINWSDKATNLRQLSEDLNIGLDSMVFLDDSAFEVDLVRNVLPTVTAIQLEKKRSVEYAAQLRSLNMFDTLTVSSEDKKRGAMYQAEAKRREVRRDIPDMESYLRSLEISLSICFADVASFPRVAQLTQKTNQFNLTTRRYSEEAIRQFSESGDSCVLRVRVSDRFGDMGIVGVVIGKMIEGVCHLDTFLISCRVIGRGVEDAMLAAISRVAIANDCTALRAEFIATKKNGQTRDFYEKHRFALVEESEGGGEKTLIRALSPGDAEFPAHLEQVDLGEGV